MPVEHRLRNIDIMTCHNLLESQVKDWIFLASLITLLFVGSALADDNQLEKQIKLANAILAKPNVSTSDRVQCYLALASSHNQLRNFAQALAEIKKAIALDKSLEESSAVIGVRAEAEINLKQTQNALNDCNKAIALMSKAGQKK